MKRIAHIEAPEAAHAGRGALLPWKAELRLMLCGEVVRVKAQPAFSTALAERKAATVKINRRGQDGGMGNGPEFFQTMMGSRFFGHTMPALVAQLERIGDQLEVVSAKLANPLVVAPPITLESAGLEREVEDLRRRLAHHLNVVRERDEAQEEARALRTQLEEARAKIARLEDPRAQP